MTQEAQPQTIYDPADMTGMDDFFSCHDKDGQEDLTLEQAAVRLNLSERTIQRRLKHRQLDGYKIPGPRGPEWRIRIKASEEVTQVLSMPTLDMPEARLDTPTATQDTPKTTQDMSQVTEDMTVTDVGVTITNTGERQTTSETGLVVSEFSRFYKEQINLLSDKLEAATFRNGYLEAQLSAAENELKLLPDLSARATRVEQLEIELAKVRAELSSTKEGWFAAFSRWFLGKRRAE